jgi:protocatechuate 3,4-dioxygenase, beta subunit
MEKVTMPFLFIFSLFANLSCHGQQGEKPLVGGTCEGCEIMYVGMPKAINAVDTSAGWNETGEKMLLKGTVFSQDAKTPVPNVIIYYYHTDNSGRYTPSSGQDEKTRRHGHIRGWVKTDSKGKYSIYTIRPAPYPDGNIPAHIHTFILESDLGNPYYIDEFVFADDPLVDKVPSFENRGGSGILKMKNSGGLSVAEHDIILGLNIPGYPAR